MTRQSTTSRQADRLLDIDEVADSLGVSHRFVRRLVAERRIPFVKVGKFVRFDPAELNVWIDGQRVGVSPKATSGSRIRR
jgi:excisionase family DNA binding protein